MPLLPRTDTVPASTSAYNPAQRLEELQSRTATSAAPAYDPKQRLQELQSRTKVPAPPAYDPESRLAELRQRREALPETVKPKATLDSKLESEPFQPATDAELDAPFEFTDELPPEFDAAKPQRSITEQVFEFGADFKRSEGATAFREDILQIADQEREGGEQIGPEQWRDMREQLAAFSPKPKEGEVISRAAAGVGGSVKLMADAASGAIVATALAKLVTVSLGSAGALGTSGVAGKAIESVAKVAGAFTATQKFHTLDIYAGLREQGFSVEISDAVAKIAGPINAGIEAVEIGLLGFLGKKGLSISGLLANPKIRQNLLKRLATSGLRILGGAGAEGLEEIAQNQTELVAKEFAAAIRDEISKSAVLKRQFGSGKALFDRANEAGKVIKEAWPTLLAFGGLAGAPGAISALADASGITGEKADSAIDNYSKFIDEEVKKRELVAESTERINNLRNRINQQEQGAGLQEAPAPVQEEIPPVIVDVPIEGPGEVSVPVLDVDAAIATRRRQDEQAAEIAVQKQAEADQVEAELTLPSLISKPNNEQVEAGYDAESVFAEELGEQSLEDMPLEQQLSIATAARERIARYIKDEAINSKAFDLTEERGNFVDAQESLLVARENVLKEQVQEQEPAVEEAPVKEATPQDGPLPWQLTAEETAAEEGVLEKVRSGDTLSPSDQAMTDSIIKKQLALRSASAQEAASMTEQEFKKWADSRVELIAQHTDIRHLPGMTEAAIALKLRGDATKSALVRDHIAGSKQSVDIDILAERFPDASPDELAGMQASNFGFNAELDKRVAEIDSTPLTVKQADDKPQTAKKPQKVEKPAKKAPAKPSVAERRAKRKAKSAAKSKKPLGPSEAKTVTDTGLQDFGEKLGGARKDLAQFASREVSDQDFETKPLSKLWPKSEVTAIEDDDLAAIAHALRSEIPAKPRVKHKVARWASQVKQVQGLMRFAEDQGAESILKRMRQSSSSLGKFADKVQVLRNIPREHWDRVGDVRFYPEAYQIKDGVKTPTPIFSAQVDKRRISRPTEKELHAAVAEKVSEEKAESQMKFEIRGRGNKWDINKKGDKLQRELRTFPTVKEARTFIKEEHATLVQDWENIKAQHNVKEKDVRRDTNRPRAGKDHREGKDATPEMFLSTFGFRGVEFGNWVSQGKNLKERQGMLNAAFDAMMDLSSILDIPPQAISLNGTLGLGLGSRGSGKASAHYEPGRIVINLTKTRGAGTFAHEWFHALDNYFRRERSARGEGKGGPYITESPETQYLSPNKKFTLAANRFNELKRAGSLRDAADWTLVEGVRPEVEEQFTELVKTLDASPMAKRSRLIDAGRSDGYWSRIVERAARAFENYTVSKMQLEGYSNDYLANIKVIEDFGLDPDRYPYLLADEIAPVAEAFDNLFQTIETRETDKGTALFRKSDTEDAKTTKAVKSAIDTFHSKIGGGQSYQILDTAEELPDYVKADAERQFSNPDAYKEVEALRTRRGIIYVAENFTDENHAVMAAVHESTHNGLRQAFGQKRLNELLDELWTDIGPEITKSIPDAYGDASPRVQTEEYLTFLGEKVINSEELTAQERTTWEKIVDWLRNAINSVLGRDALAARVKGETSVTGPQAIRIAEILRDAARSIRGTAFARSTLSQGESAALRGKVESDLAAAASRGFRAPPLRRSMPVEGQTKRDVGTVEGQGLLFRMNDGSSVADSQYMNAVDSGDMDAAQKMVDDAAKAAGFANGPLYHGGNFNIEEDSTFFVDEGLGVHFGTEAAAQDRIGGAPVDHYIQELETENFEGEWYWSIGGYDGEVGFATEAEAREKGEEEAVQMGELSDLEGQDFTTPVHTALSNPVTLPDLGTWGLNDIISNLPPAAALSASEKSTIFTAQREGRMNDDWAELRKALTSKGFDGVKYRNLVEDKGSTSFIAFSPSQIKSADPVTRDDDGNVIPLSQRFDTQRDDIRFRRGYQGFYSPLERAVDKVDFRTMPAADLKARILKTPGIKAEEFEDLGLIGWLDGIDGKVAKEDVLNFIREEGPQLVDVTKGQVTAKTSLADFSDDHLREKIIELDPNREAEASLDAMSREELFAELDALADEDAREDEIDQTKFGEYQLPGGTNYREVLVTLPVEADIAPNYQQWVHESGIADRMEAAVEYQRLYPPKDKSQFTSAHWQEKNVLAHIRMNDRVGPNGENILFIEEIQSDWHQEGRKKGYKKGGLKQTNFSGWLKENNKELSEEEQNRQFDEGNGVEYDAYKAEQRAAQADVIRVPDAPFKKSWHMLALKRMMQEAVGAGYDSIAWTPGQVQADRYDLSKQIDEVVTFQYPDNTYQLRVLKNGEHIVEKDVSEAELADTVGKDLARKIIDSHADDTDNKQRKFSGLDLQVGGEGMKGFYDKILPNELGKYAKKLNGKVEVAGILTTKEGDPIREDAELYNVRDGEGFIINDAPISLAMAEADVEANLERGYSLEKADGTPQATAQEGFTEEVWSLPITDEMRHSLMTNGQPLYRMGPGEEKSAEEGVLAWGANMFKDITEPIFKREKDSNEKPEVSKLRTTFTTISHYSEKVPTTKRVYDVGRDSDRRKHEILTDVLGDLDREGDLGQIHQFMTKGIGFFGRLRGKINVEGQLLKDYLVLQDRDAVGPTAKKAKNDTWNVYDSGGKKIHSGISTEAEAWTAAHQWEADQMMKNGISPEAATQLVEEHGYSQEEVDQLVKDGVSPEAADVLMRYRTISDRGFEELMRSVREYEAKMKELGGELNEEELDLFAALRAMGDRRGHYMPRRHGSGRLILKARRGTKESYLRKFNNRVSRARAKRELEADGWTDFRFSLSKDPSEYALGDLSLVNLIDTVKAALAQLKANERSVSWGQFGMTREITDDRMIVRGNPTRYEEAFKKAGGTWSEEDQYWSWDNPSDTLSNEVLNSVAQTEYGEFTPTELVGKALVKEIAILLHAHGSRSAKISRNEEVGEAVTQGYDTDPIGAMIAYGSSIAGGSAKREMAQKMLKFVTGTDISWKEYKEQNPLTDKKDKDASAERWRSYQDLVKERRLDSATQPNAYKATMKYIQDLIRNDESSEQLMKTVRGFAAFNFLTGLGPVPVNMSAVLTNVPPEMKLHANIPFRRAPRLILRGLKKYGEHYLYHKFGTGEELTNSQPFGDKWLFDTITKRGYDEAPMTREALGVAGNQLGQTWGRMTNIVAFPFSISERFNRAATIAGSYDGIREQHKGEWTEQDANDALEKAHYISDQAHGTYGKVNIPDLTRSPSIGAQVLRSFYTYKTFTHNYLTNLSKHGYKDATATLEAIKNKDAKALTKAMADNTSLFLSIAPMILGGVAAGAGGMGIQLASGILKGIFELVPGAEPPDDLEEWIWEQSVKAFGDTGGRLARQGVAGLTGFNLSGSLGIRGEDFVPTTVKDLLGAPYSMLEGYGKSAVELSRGNFLRATELASPRFLKGPLKALRERREGVSTRSGAAVYWGDQRVQPTWYDTVIRFGGFNPSAISEKRERQWKETRIRATYNDMRREIYRQIRLFVLKPAASQTRNEWARILQDVEEYNARLARQGHTFVSEITERSIKRVVSDAGKPNRFERKARR